MDYNLFYQKKLYIWAGTPPFVFFLLNFNITFRSFIPPSLPLSFILISHTHSPLLPKCVKLWPPPAPLHNLWLKKNHVNCKMICPELVLELFHIPSTSSNNTSIWWNETDYNVIKSNSQHFNQGKLFLRILSLLREALRSKKKKLRDIKQEREEIFFGKLSDV